MGMAMSADKHNYPSTVQAATCIESAHILLAKSSHMTKLKEKGKGHTTCLIVEELHDCMARGTKCGEE